MFSNGVFKAAGQVVGKARPGENPARPVPPAQEGVGGHLDLARRLVSRTPNPDRAPSPAAPPSGWLGLAGQVAATPNAERAPAPAAGGWARQAAQVAGSQPMPAAGAGAPSPSQAALGLWGAPSGRSRAPLPPSAITPGARAADLALARRFRSSLPRPYTLDDGRFDRDQFLADQNYAGIIGGEV